MTGSLVVLFNVYKGKGWFGSTSAYIGVRVLPSAQENFVFLWYE